jgi:YYY domain-containing protein
MDQSTRPQNRNQRILILTGTLLTLILLVAAFLRFRGLLWGEYQYLHPDERFLIWVGTDISPVSTLSEYWDTANSSLNPHNEGHSFYVYGTFPLYLARYFVEWIYEQSGFNEMTNVGRFLSATADLLTILFVYLVGQKVYNRLVGLLAAAFSAFAVLQIQHAHFFTVDTFTTFFALVTIYFAARIAYEGRDPDEGSIEDEPEKSPSSETQTQSAKRFTDSVIESISKFARNPLFSLSLGFGLALGFAVSSKINAVPLAFLLPAALFIRFSKLNNDNKNLAIRSAILYLFLAGFVSLLVFRVLQPMAFSGPGFFGLKPNPAWIANLRELQNQTGGDVDFPPALQWARRSVGFAWQNMVLWGMGIPMGLLAWGGFLWIGWRMLKGEWRQHVLLWGWTAFYFTWQSLIFNPSMRYQLLVYPTLVIFAAWGIIRLYNWGKNNLSRKRIVLENNLDGNEITREAAPFPIKFGRVFATVIGGGVLLATAVYAFSFSNIYTTPITRVEASRWIYQNIPGPINLPIQTQDGIYNQPISYPYSYVVNSDLPYVRDFTAQRSGKLTEIGFGRIIDPQSNFGDKVFRLAVSEIPGNRGRSESVSFHTSINPEEPGSAQSSHATFSQPLELNPDQEYFIELSLPPSQGPVRINGSLDLTIQGNQIYHQSIPLSNSLVDFINPFQASFPSQDGGFLTDAALNIVNPVPPAEKIIELSISKNPDDNEQFVPVTSSGVLRISDGSSASVLALNEQIPLDEGQGYSLSINLVDPQGEIILRGTPIANEGAWDDGLPVRIDGYDGFSGIFEPGLNFDMYEDDNPNKLSRFYDILDHTEYILISSSRQWGSLPRIPERYPMMVEYYRHLLGCPPNRTIEWCYNVAKVGTFRGDLGFELVEVFQSDPALGPIRLNDQPSEEAFTVYDHPKVFIFRKEPDYDPENIRAILGEVDLTKVVHVTPKKAGDIPKDMMLPVDRLSQQLNGGTWSQLFDINGLQNRWPFVGAIIWYLAVAMLGIISYPIIRFALPALADRGYPLARIAGLLILSWLAWLSGSVNIPFTRLTITLIVFFMLVVSSVFIYLQRASLRQEWRERRNYFLIIEGLFLAFFVFDLFIRIGNPDLWHPWKGGEKPMDFSYLNAVLKSTSFPPYDPWFAGGYINYYYYGFVLVGVLVKWLGIVPSIAYNLIIPTLFSMIALAAFSIGWNLISVGASALNRKRPLFKSLPFITGLAASLGLAVLGNLGTLRMIFHGYQRLASPGGNIEGANILIRTIWSIKGALMTLTGSSLPYGIADWYWLPSRAIPAPNDVEPITEFPFFTVLYGDPHAHLFALPLTLLAFTWAISVVFSKGWRQNQGGKKMRSYIQVAVSFLVGGLAIGALRPTNTWDFPTYLMIGILAVGYAVWRYYQPGSGSTNLLDGMSGTIQRILITSGSILLLTLLSFLLYQPYANWYVQGYTNIQLWRGTHTPFWSYLTHWGVFLVAIISWMVLETREWMASTPVSALRKLTPYRGLILTGLILFLVWIIALLIFGVSIAWFVIPLVLWAGVLLLRPGLPDAKRVVLVMVCMGLLLTVMVEVIVLVGDIGRMNTVFKFYLQVWTLLALSAAAGFGWILLSINEWQPGWRTAWQVVMVFLVASAALYPLLGGTAKIKDRMTPEDAPHTLDGMAFMEFAEFDDLGTRMDLSQDYQAIRWLQENVVGSPVIIEGNMVEYHWGTRNTIYSGLPNVIGWNWHQRQQRALAPEHLIPERINDVNDFYITTDPSLAQDILRRYGVEYVIVGQLERALYPGPGLDKFNSLDGVLWHEVFQTGDTLIYQVDR